MIEQLMIQEQKSLGLSRICKCSMVRFDQIAGIQGNRDSTVSNSWHHHEHSDGLGKHRFRVLCGAMFVIDCSPGMLSVLSTLLNI